MEIWGDEIVTPSITKEKLLKNVRSHMRQKKNLKFKMLMFYFDEVRVWWTLINLIIASVHLTAPKAIETSHYRLCSLPNVFQ